MSVRSVSLDIRAMKKEDIVLLCALLKATGFNPSVLTSIYPKHHDYDLWIELHPERLQGVIPKLLEVIDLSPKKDSP